MSRSGVIGRAHAGHSAAVGSIIERQDAQCATKATCPTRSAMQRRGKGAPYWFDLSMLAAIRSYVSEMCSSITRFGSVIVAWAVSQQLGRLIRRAFAVSALGFVATVYPKTLRGGFSDLCIKIADAYLICSQCDALIEDTLLAGPMATLCPGGCQWTSSHCAALWKPYVFNTPCLIRDYGTDGSI